jgi:hypothetical protein
MPALGSTPHADEFEPVRQRIRQYGLRSSEEKILVQLRKFKATEEMYLKWFAEAEREGAIGLLTCYQCIDATLTARLPTCSPCQCMLGRCAWRAPTAAQ